MRYCRYYDYYCKVAMAMHPMCSWSLSYSSLALPVFILSQRRGRSSMMVQIYYSAFGCHGYGTEDIADHLGRPQRQKVKQHFSCLIMLVISPNLQSHVFFSLGESHVCYKWLISNNLKWCMFYSPIPYMVSSSTNLFTCLRNFTFSQFLTMKATLTNTNLIINLENVTHISQSAT